QYDYQGEQTVKNIAKPVRVYRIVMGAADTQPAPGKGLQTPGEKLARHVRSVSLLVIGLLLLTGILATVRYGPLSSFRTSPSPLHTQEEKPSPLPLPDKPSLVVLPF